jgi:hypothetical protein
MTITQAHRLLSEARAGTHCPSREEWIEIVDAVADDVRERASQTCLLAQCAPCVNCHSNDSVDISRMLLYPVT